MEMKIARRAGAAFASVAVAVGVLFAAGGAASAATQPTRSVITVGTESVTHHRTDHSTDRAWNHDREDRRNTDRDRSHDRGEHRRNDRDRGYVRDEYRSYDRDRHEGAGKYRDDARDGRRGWDREDRSDRSDGLRRFDTGSGHERQYRDADARSYSQHADRAGRF
ncbi:hypothetical protein ABZ642_26550 [Streptomyces sp. NPDC007157]|uniref:hypothetical protein n=1 Tax=Streptomyces sp. NPDC007157 TaxID=3154681 RepID=UPI0033DE779A